VGFKTPILLDKDVPQLPRCVRAREHLPSLQVHIGYDQSADEVQKAHLNDRSRCVLEERVNAHELVRSAVVVVRLCRVGCIEF